MAALAFAAINCDAPVLAQAIRQALSLSFPPEIGYANGSMVVAHPAITEANRTAIQSVINGYTFTPPAPEPPSTDTQQWAAGQFSPTAHTHAGGPGEPHPDAEGHEVIGVATTANTDNAIAAAVSFHAATPGGHPPVAHDHDGTYEPTHSHPYATDIHTHPGGGGGVDNIPIGTIAMWSGLLANIPTGWSLCDGLNGTPDLRDRFVIGAAAGQNPGATGGTTTHTHSDHTGVINHTHPVTDPGHSHLTQRYPTATGSLTGFTADTSMNGTPANNTLPTASGSTGVTTNNPAGGVSAYTHDTGSNLPPFYSLAYIMKTSAAPGEVHPDLAAHDTLGLATQAELDAVAATITPHPNLATHDGLGLATQAELDIHNHDASYSPLHTHPFATDTHNHDAMYSLLGHAHGAVSGAPGVYKANVGRVGSTYSARDVDGNIISEGTNFHTVGQAALNFVAANGGGTCFLRSAIYEHTGTSSLAVPFTADLMGEGWHMNNGTTGAPTGGTIIRQTASNPTNLIDMQDAWGSHVYNLSVDCNNLATNGIHASGWQQRIHDVQTYRPANGGQGIYATGGNNATQFGYADMHFYNLLLSGNGNTVKGIFVDQSVGSNKSSDGNIGPNVRSFGCHSGIIEIQCGGWVIDGPNHITGNTSVPFAIKIIQGQVSDTYVDAIGNGHAIEATGDRVIISGIRVETGGTRNTTNTTSAIKLANGAEGIIIDNIWLNNNSNVQVGPWRHLVDTGLSPANRGIAIGDLVVTWSPGATNPIGHSIVGAGSTDYTTAVLANYAAPRSALSIGVT